MTTPPVAEQEAGYEHLLVTRDGNVTTITLNRPAQLNALNTRIGVELLDALRRCAADPAVRAVVLTGAGRAFCAGDDLRQTSGFNERQPGQDLARRYVYGDGRWPSIVFAIRAVPKPVIAMINGYAFGAGFNLALACDFRVAAVSATLATPFVKRGMGTGVNLLNQYVGIGTAARMVLTGDPITAAEAERLGLVTWAVPDADLAGRTGAFAAEMARAATATLGLTKTALYQGWPEPPERAYERQGLAVYQSSLTEDRAEGQRAFLEKRPPAFQGR
ncbi:MAG: enoyl-CoA hydratase-related protein [Dehalococcoidia bacterium]